jgi:hypothetical protein
MNQVDQEIAEELAWAEWRNLPQGQLLRKYLLASQQSLKDQWAAKAFMGEQRDEVLILNAAALGALEAYQFILDLTHQQIMEVLSDE